MVKKGQGALEFLMTYGWAFLVILIMIGALAYFGILNPTRFLPDRCDFGTQILCKENQFIINSNDNQTIVATVVNNMGSNIKTYGWTVSTDVAAVSGCQICFDNDTTNDPACTGVGGTDADLDAATAASPILWPEGASQKLTLECTGGDQMVPGDKNKFQIKFKWYASTAGPQYARDGSGEIYSSVQ